MDINDWINDNYDQLKSDKLNNLIMTQITLSK